MQDKISILTKEQLDHEVENLPPSVSAELAVRRRQAILQAKEEDTHFVRRSFSRLGDQIKALIAYRHITPVALAVCLAVLVNYLYQPAGLDKNLAAIPALPKAMVTDGVPNEELALLQDLEFATWLSEQSTSQQVSL